VKILLSSGGIIPSRITAAGRGEFVPLVANDSNENKAKNRRTEIILTPKLDELFQIIESN
jgi:chemotaxis protein MotB